MATYTTQSELEATVDNLMLAQLADEATTTDIATQAEATTSLALAGTKANITQAIERASNVIDVELLGHVDLTNASVLARLKILATDMALYFLFQRRYMDEEKNPWRGAYFHALKIMKAVRERKNRLAIDPDRPDSQVSSSTSSASRSITSTTLSDYV